MKKAFLYILPLIFISIILIPNNVQANLLPVYGNNGQKNSYLPVQTKVYNNVYGMVSTFNPDNLTNFPYEVYLPNESNPALYRVHSNFTKNTDSCASCHTTHTSVGPGLLQWYSDYATCMACHDGTVTTTYNVLDGKIQNSNNFTNGGLFGRGNENFLSAHNASGIVEVASVPGEVYTDTSPQDLNGDGVIDRWGFPFTCTSCHEPHGAGGNARLLSPNPNGQAYLNKKEGVLMAGLSSTEFTVYPGAFVNSVGETTYTPYRWLTGYEYEPFTKIVTDQGVIDPTSYTIDNSRGYTLIKFTYAPTVPLYAYFVPAIRVVMDIENYLSTDPGKPEKISYISGISEFCASCHPSYYKTTVDLQTYFYENYRHPVDLTVYPEQASVLAQTYNIKFEYDPTTGTFSKINCLTCHTAHGVNQDYWLKTGTVPEEAYENTGSSALKRLPNMKSCVLCHPDKTGYFMESPTPTNYYQGSSQYVGSLACKSCHQNYYEGWQKTAHARTIGFGFNSIVADAVYPLEPSVNGFRYRFTYSGLNDKMASAGNLLYRLIDSTRADVYPEQVTLSVGFKWLQSYAVYDTTYNLLSGSFNVPAKKFTVFSGVYDLNSCLGCHGTGFKVTSVNNQTYEVTGFELVERGVGCEACHGPGKNHTENPNHYNIYNPKYQTPELRSSLCGQCHSKGVSLLYQQQTVMGLTYREDFLAPVDQRVYPWSVDWYTYGLIPGLNDPIYGTDNLGPYLVGSSNPTPILSLQNLFYPAVDSIYRDARAQNEYPAFRQSLHYKTGSLACNDCHNSHGTNLLGESLKTTQGQLCSSCHDGTRLPAVDMPKTASLIDSIYLSSHTFGGY
ncbi:cytochrome c3 family protein [Carboxydothermus pertinax]|nr:cytochrome c3 family protein [Carboxydothermus pertinax]